MPEKEWNFPTRRSEQVRPILPLLGRGSEFDILSRNATGTNLYKIFSFICNLSYAILWNLVRPNQRRVRLR